MERIKKRLKDDKNFAIQVIYLFKKIFLIKNVQINFINKLILKNG